MYEDAVEEWEDAVDESGDEDLGGQREEDVLVHARRPLASHAVSSFSEGHAAPTVCHSMSYPAPYECIITNSV